MSSPIHFVRRHLISAFVSLACLFGLAMSGSATGSMVITGKQIQDDSIPTRGATRTPRSSGSTTPTLLPVLGPPRPAPTAGMLYVWSAETPSHVTTESGRLCGGSVDGLDGADNSEF